MESGVEADLYMQREKHCFQTPISAVHYGTLLTYDLVIPTSSDEQKFLSESRRETPKLFVEASKYAIEPTSVK
jgi:hypothetical protein